MKELSDRERLAVLYPWKEGMREISGFGGGYEEACRWMVRRGLEWLREHPDQAAHILKNDPLHLVLSNAREEFEDFIASQEDGCTGAMVGAALSHACYAYKHGWEGYQLEMQQSNKEES